MCSKLTLAIVVSLGLATLVTSNDILMGHASPYSNKIYSAIKIEDPAFWRRTDDIVISAPYHEYISAIYITDLRPDKDGEAYVEAGGLGSRSVTIALKSPSVLRGYKFSIDVYAQSVHSGFYHNVGYMNYNNPMLSGVGVGGQYPSYPASYPSNYPSTYSSTYPSNYPVGLSMYPNRY